MKKRLANDVKKRRAALLATSNDNSKSSSDSSSTTTSASGSNSSTLPSSSSPSPGNWMDDWDVKIDDEIYHRIGSTQWYTQDEMDCVGKIITKTHPTQWTVAGSVGDILDFLTRTNSKQLDTTIAIETSPRSSSFSIIYNKGGVHWVTFCILKWNLNGTGSKFMILYKDSFGLGMDPELEQMLRTHFDPHPLEIIVNESCEQEDDISCGPMSLKNLKIILQLFIPPSKIVMEMETETEIPIRFKSTTFCSQDKVEEVKTQFQFRWKEEQRYHLKSCLTQLSQCQGKDLDLENFKMELTQFIDFCSQFFHEENDISSTNYTNVLMEEMKAFEENSNYVISQSRIDEAKRKFYDSKLIQESLQKARKNLNNNSSMATNKNTNKEVDNHMIMALDIQQKYPIQFKLFTNIFKILATVKSDDNLAIVLKKVSQLYGIEYEKLKIFFKFQQQQQQEQEKEEEEKENPEDLKNQFMHQIQKVARKLPNPPPTRQEEEDRTCKCLNEILAELQLESKVENVGGDDAKKILELENNFKKVQNFRTTWHTKTAIDIGEWTLKVRGDRSKLDVNEVLAVMDRANELVTGGHRLRVTQILSILIFLQKDDTDEEIGGSGNKQTGTKTTTAKRMGRLCQIQAGEGKTTIVALLATLRILQGDYQTVDVITSNSILAQVAVEEKSNFYALFGISTATNNPEDPDDSKCRIKMATTNTNTPRACYSVQVLYGSIGSFQFDYLLESFEGRKTRNGRPFGCLILDEVDSMLIDNGGHIAKICGPLPGMDSLKHFYIRIWSQLTAAEDKIMVEMKTQLDAKRGELMSRSDLLPQEREGEYEEFSLNLFLSMGGKLRDAILESKPLENCIILPSHLVQFAHTSLNKWIENAIWAKYSCHENHHYRLKEVKTDEGFETKVVPIDYANTGVSMSNTNWSGGLHQFVQLKHNIHLTAESMTCSLVSNYGYIKLYGQIFGMTGTLGFQPEQDLLYRMYHVGFSIIPTYKKKKFQELPGIVVPDEDWALEVAIEAICQVCENGRAVLIISQSIADSLLIEEELDSLKIFLEKQPNQTPWSSKSPRKFPSSKITIQKFHDEADSKVMQKEVEVGDIISATNIAGRGADFRTSGQLEKNGGIHVILSFCPDNERVKDQAFFRTSRQGNAGSARLVIRESQLRRLGIELESDFTTKSQTLLMEQVKQRKLQVEAERVDQLKVFKVAQLFFQDTIFALFAKKCNELKSKFNVDMYVLKDFKDFWAFWIEKQALEMESDMKNGVTATVTTEGSNWEENLMEKVQKDFFKFEQEAAKIFNFQKSNRTIHLSSSRTGVLAGGSSSGSGSGSGSGVPPLNPFYGIQQAESILVSPGTFNNEQSLKEAEEVLNHAISLNPEPNTLYSTYMKLFEISMERGGVLMSKFWDCVAKVFIVGYFTNVKESEYKKNALLYLNKAEDALQREYLFIEEELGQENFGRILKPCDEGQGNNNELLSQLQSKLVCLQIYKEHVQMLRQQIENCTQNVGLTIGSRVSNYLEKLEGRTGDEKKLKESILPCVLTELKNVGMDTMYGLMQVYDAPTEIVVGAQAQIGAGLSLYGAGIAFPPSLPAAAPIAGTLITEGLMDIALELVNYKRAYGFDQQAYIKSKVISYGISLLTLGLKAILSCTKIMEKAASACKYLSDVLRNCPYLKTVCELVARGLDKLALFFDKMVQLSLQVKQAMTLTTLLYGSCKTMAVGVTSSVVMEKLVMAGLHHALQLIKPQVEKIVWDTVSNSELASAKSQGKLKQLGITIGQLDILISNVMDDSTLGQDLWKIGREISFGISRHMGNWKVKAASLTLDSLMSANRIRMYPLKFCEKFNKTLLNLEDSKCGSSGEPQETQMTMTDHMMAELMWHISTKVTDKVYGSIVQLAGKLTHTLIVAPLTNKLFEKLFSTIDNSNGDKEKKLVKKSTTNQNPSEDPKEEESMDIKSTANKKALSLLGLDENENVSPEDIKRAYRIQMRKNHPDINPGDLEANKKCSDLNNAKEYLDGKCGAQRFLNNITPSPSPTAASAPASTSVPESPTQSGSIQTSDSSIPPPNDSRFGADQYERMDLVSDPEESFSTESVLSDYQQMELNPDGLSDNCYMTTMTSIERLQDVDEMAYITNHQHQGPCTVEQILEIHSRFNELLEKPELSVIQAKSRDEIDSYCKRILPVGQQVDLGYGYDGHLVTLRARRVSVDKVVYSTTDYQQPASSTKRSFKGMPVSTEARPYIEGEEPFKYLILDPGQSRYRPIPPDLMDKYLNQ